VLENLRHNLCAWLCVGPEREPPPNIVAASALSDEDRSELARGVHNATRAAGSLRGSAVQLREMGNNLDALADLLLGDDVDRKQRDAGGC
jgi:hypothetical protein